MSTVFLSLVSLCISTSYGQSYEEKQVEKECAGVKAEFVAALRGFTQLRPKSQSHAVILRDIRQRLAESEDQETEDIPETCVAAVVREVVVERAAAATRPNQPSAAASAAITKWETLSAPERLWVSRFWKTGGTPTIGSLTTDAIGSFQADARMRIVAVVSLWDAVVLIDARRIGDPVLAWLEGVRTDLFIPGEERAAPPGVFWISEWVEYQTATGGEQSVPYVKHVKDFDAKELAKIVPPDLAPAKTAEAQK